MLRASIDIGSNSVLLLIGDVTDEGIEEISDNTMITGLGKNLDSTGKFTTESMKETMATLKKYKSILKKYDIEVSECLVTATEASRVAENSEEFFNEVRKKCGFKINILSGVGEAYYTARGVALSHLNNDDDTELVIMDLGGASSELILVKARPFHVKQTVSLPVGSVRAQDWIEEGIFQKKMDDVLHGFEMAPYKTENLVCVAGSLTSLGAMMKGLTSFEGKKINQQKIDFKDFCTFTDKIVAIDKADLLSQYPFLGKRARTIGAGAG